MSCINEKKMEDFIHAASPRQLSKIWFFTTELIYYWGMYTLEDVFQVIDTYIPEIYGFVDINEIKNRMQKIEQTGLKVKSNSNETEIHEFLPLGFKSDIKEDIPELITIRDTFQEAFVSVPSGLEKTEAWLYPHALEAGADADLEALVYFKSKGESLVSSHELSETWRKTICSNVAKGQLHCSGEKIIEKAKKNDLLLIDLAEIFRHSIRFSDFLHAYDNEEDFITATFFRTMEWFQLNEYEPWADVYAQEISTAYQGGVDHVYSLYPLFYYCRSDLLLRKVSKFGLEALLYGICVGNIDPSKPWKQYWEEPSEGRKNITYVDYIPTASIIVFAWQRINPTNINKEILDQALLLLFQTQLVSGAWPLTTKDTKGDILSTCLALTALVVLKPIGYQRYVDKGKEWLLSQQNEVGCWHIQGGPAVMINILCLEAIRMAKGDYQITYKVQDYQIDRELRTHSIGKTTDKYIIFCEGNSEGTKNKNFDEKCYTKIFSIEFPNAVFCSIGSCKDIETENNLLFKVIKKVNPYHRSNPLSLE